MALLAGDGPCEIPVLIELHPKLITAISYESMVPARTPSIMGLAILINLGYKVLYILRIIP